MFSTTLPAIAQKDTVNTRSGIQLIGNVKSLSQGVMVFGASFAQGDVKIKWKEVESLYIQHRRRIFDKNGNRFIGRIIHASDSLRKAYILVDYDSLEISYSEIVQIDELKEDFIDRFQLGLNFGFGYTRANNSTQINLRSNVGYLGEKWVLQGNLNSFATSIDTVVTSRGDASFSLKRYLFKDWYGIATLQALNSDAQKLDLRLTGLLGLGNYLIQNQKMAFSLSLGAAFNKERFAGTTDAELNLESYEGFVGVDYILFGANDVDVATNLLVLPSITERSRARVNYTVDVKWNIFKNLNLKLGYTLNYDTNPPNNARKNDYVYSLTFGWKL